MRVSDSVGQCVPASTPYVPPRSSLVGLHWLFRRRAAQPHRASAQQQLSRRRVPPRRPHGYCVRPTRPCRCPPPPTFPRTSCARRSMTIGWTTGPMIPLLWILRIQSTLRRRHRNVLVTHRHPNQNCRDTAQQKAIAEKRDNRLVKRQRRHIA